MKRVLAILGAALAAAAGLLMPHLTAAVQERRLAGEVRQIENSAVSLTLAEETAEPAELTALESIRVFSGAVASVALEEGRYTGPEGVVETARELTEWIGADVWYTGEAASAEAVPYLLIDGEGRSGVFWRCGLEKLGRPEEAVWIDDRNRQVVGFCLSIGNLPTDEPALTRDICERFLPLGVETDLIETDGGVRLYMEYGGEAVYVPIQRAGPYLYFNFLPVVGGSMSRSVSD